MPNDKAIGASSSNPVSPNTLTYQSPPQRLVVAISLFILAMGAIALSHYGWKQSVLFLIGGLLGVTLYHSSFGFASAYRQLLVNRNVQGAIAQLVMLAIATLLFAPVLAGGAIGGQTVRGAISPISVSGAIGALLFGIGMQLGGACGCGTLYTLGGGSLTMLLTLLTFCLGAFGASLTRQLWAGLPAAEPIVLGREIGWISAVGLQWVLLAFLAVALVRWQRSGTLQKSIVPLFSVQSFNLNFVSCFRGPWSLLVGAIVLAVLNCLTLILSGQPWRITWGFALWAAQFATWLGWDSTSSQFWRGEATQKVLNQGIFADVSSVMNLGILLGAMLAAGLAGRLIPRGLIAPRFFISSLLGGGIMGYGAFLAYGCNISAFLGGIASTSLHGWVWIVFALSGTLIGVRLRPFFHLD